MNASELQTLCGAWPGAASGIKAEDELVFSVAGKAFAVLCLRGPERERLSFKVDAEQFVDFTSRSGIVAAHYAARPFWVTLIEPERFTRAAMEKFVRRSYELVRDGLGKKQQHALRMQQAPVDAAATTKKNSRKG